MITYNWTFPQFVIEPSIDGLTNVVTAMTWMCTAVNDLNGQTALNSGRVVLQPPNPEQFVPFEEITQEMAMGWLAAYISIPGVEQALDVQLNRAQQPVQPINPPFTASSS